MGGYARPVLKTPVGKKSMVVRIHSGPSLKAFRVAIWVGSLIRQATRRLVPTLP